MLPAQPSVRRANVVVPQQVDLRAARAQECLDTRQDADQQGHQKPGELTLDTWEDLAEVEKLCKTSPLILVAVISHPQNMLVNQPTQILGKLKTCKKNTLYWFQE